MDAQAELLLRKAQEDRAVLALTMEVSMAAPVTPDSMTGLDPGLVTKEKILHVVEKIIAKADPLWIVAFGSRARGTHRPESDLDLAVMVTQYDPKRDKWPVSRSDLDVFMAVDLLVFSKDRHEFMRDSIISVHHDIAKEGVILYDKRVGSIDLGAVERISR